MNRLEIRNLTKSYGNRNVNKDINLTLENGVYGLLEPNGSGKPTIMTQIATLGKTTKGLDKKDVNKKVDELLDLVGLYDVRNKGVGKFSGGMKRRIGIAQALLNDPKIIILDEPTAGLDPQERTRFRNLLSDMSKDKIIILSTHIVSDIESIAKETIMIKNGEIIMVGSNREILSDMDGKVYTIKIHDEDKIEEIRRKYKVVNLQRGMDYTELRI